MHSRRMFHTGGKSLVVALAVALALEPAWGRAESLHLAVNLAAGAGRGETVVGGASDPLVRVYRDVDVGAVHDWPLWQLMARKYFG